MIIQFGQFLEARASGPRSRRALLLSGPKMHERNARGVLRLSN